MTCAQSAPADGEFFRDRTVVVTGGASGIGRAVVETLLAARARVAVFDLRAQHDFLDAAVAVEEKERKRLAEMMAPDFFAFDAVKFGYLIAGQQKINRLCAAPR